MEWERQGLRVCAAALLCAMALRVVSSGALGRITQRWNDSQWASFLLYLETGRVVKALPVVEPTVQTEPPQTQASEPKQTPLTLSATDLEPVEIKYICSYRPELEPLLLQPLNWNLTQAEPTVLILHTHTSESYEKQSGDSYVETSDYHTMDEAYNMLRVGDAMEEQLEAAGIGVVHDRKFHDQPSYNGSYNNAQASIESYLAQNPSIQLVLDIHRDAVDTGNGQLRTSCTVDGQASAQLMLVIGSDEGGLQHPNWQDNLSLALKLDAVLERLYPGVCRPISFRSERFNQHESPGALLVEVGAAGNSLEEALIAASALCDGIIALAHGAQAED